MASSPRRCCMADPIVEPVSYAALELVKQRLQGITVARGYYTDIGLGVLSTDPRTQRKDPVEIITLITGEDITDNVPASGPRTTVSDMGLVIEVAIPFDVEENPALVAHRARHDLYRALRDDVRDAAIGLRSLKTTGSHFTIGNDGSAVVIAQITARAGLAESIPPAP